LTSSDYAIEQGGHVLLGNRFIEASIDTGPKAGLLRLTNKITGRDYQLREPCEVSLRFQTDAHCAWIRDWRLKMGSAEAVEPELESGFLQGFHQPDIDDADWSWVALINDLTISPAGYSAVLYPGYAWYRTRFDLPADAIGKPVEIVAGGTDNQDWLHYHFYVNGTHAGESSPRGHWHPSPKVIIDPADPPYAALHFGGENLLAVQARGLDRSFAGMRMSDCERYSVGTWLVDQRVSVGPLEYEIRDFRLVDHTSMPPGILPGGRAEAPSPRYIQWQTINVTWRPGRRSASGFGRSRSACFRSIPPMTRACRHSRPPSMPALPFR